MKSYLSLIFLILSLTSLMGCSTKTVEVVKTVKVPEYIFIPESFLVPCPEDVLISTEDKSNRLEKIIQQSLERKQRLHQCSLRMDSIIQWNNIIKKELKE